MHRMMARKLAGAALIVGLALALSACLLAPGRFTSTLDLRRNGSFSFSYSGEIWVASLSRLAETAAAPAPFVARPCPDSAGQPRACSPLELARQEQDHAAEAKRAAEREAQGRAMMQAMLGGIDPASPGAAEDLADRLRHQAGWRRVDYKGNGVFQVDFALSGRLDHDFTFPTIERLPGVTPFVQVTRRQDGSVRVETPGFAGGPGAASIRAMMMGAGMPGMTGKADPAKPAPLPDLPTTDGVFTLATDGTLLANNTEDGPQSANGTQTLRWTVTAQSATGPMALIALK